MQATGGPSPADSPAPSLPTAEPARDVLPPLTTERLVAEHADVLYRLAFRLSRSPAAAEDLVQEAFLIAHRQLHQLRNQQTARKWLYRILHSCWSRHCAKENRRAAVAWNASHEPVTEAPEPVDGSELQAALDKLPDEFRAPVVLFYFDDLKYREIAEVLDCPIGTVMSRIARGKAMLRSLLSGTRG